MPSSRIFQCFGLMVLMMLALGSCKTDKKTQEKLTQLNADKGNSDGEQQTIDLAYKTAKSIKNHNGISYRFNLVPALDFVKRSGQTPVSEDLASLKQETVLIVEFSSLKQGVLSVLDHKSVKYNRDDAVKYLVGEFSQDITISQEGKTFIPTGLNYEGTIGNTGDIRGLVFFNGVDPDMDSKIHYYDRLFGSGLINISLAGKNKIVL